MNGRLSLPARPARRRPDRAGFALLITITLLAFLVLLLVSLATLTRVETQVADNQQKRDQARLNALLALNLALGELQKQAGPDQRITARAELRPNGVGAPKQPYLTGTWKSTAGTLTYSTPETWLVSGNQGADPRAITADTLDPTAAAGADEVFLLGSGTVSTAAERIKARKQPIISSLVPGMAGAQLVGNFAWWVGDEGVKAKVSLADPYAEAAPDRRIYSFVNAQRTGIESITGSGGAALSTGYPANADSLRRVLALNQLPLAGLTPAARDVLQDAIHHRFHALTPRAFSVLADTAQGGLKKDLTAWLSSTGTLPPGAPADSDPLIPGATDFMLPRWGALRSWHGLREAGTPLAPRAQTETQQGLYPVITYFRLGLAVSPTEENGPLAVHFFPLVVLWNPFNVRIAATGYELCFSLRQNTPVDFSINGVNKATLHTAYGVVTTKGGAAPTLPPFYRFPVDAPILEPGESRVFTLDATEAPYVAGTNTLVNAVNSGNTAFVTGGDTLSTAEIEYANTSGQGIAWKIGTGTVGWAGDGDLILRAAPPAGADGLPADPNDYYTLLPGAYHTVQRVGYPPTVVPVSTTDAISAKMQFLMLVRTAASVAGGRLFAMQNLRAPLAARPGFDNGINALYAGSANTSTGLPGFAGARASMGTVFSGSTNLVLAEFLPADVPLFSLAQLQHANLSLLATSPAYVVGNSLSDARIPLDATTTPVGPATATGGNQNLPLADRILNAYDLSWLINRELWDHYFLSTVSDDLSADNLADRSYRLPNARHTFADPLAPLDEVRGKGAFNSTAAHLLLDGGFNINSTSEQAWRAVLAGTNGLGYDPQTREVSATRLVYPISRYARPTGGANQVWSGYRSLTEAQINRLAYNIVREVRARGPFRSLAEFVNRRLVDDRPAFAGSDGGPQYKGALQAAIDRTDYETDPADGPPIPSPRINGNSVFGTGYVALAEPSSNDLNRMRGGTTASRPHTSKYAFAPGYLTQADLLSVLGPSLTPRSDTFVIRAYGDRRNPVTEETEGRAWCEAVVQRTAAYVNPSLDPWQTPAVGDTNDTFGRRFEVVSFRWLTADEI